MTPETDMHDWIVVPKLYEEEAHVRCTDCGATWVPGERPTCVEYKTLHRMSRIRDAMVAVVSIAIVLCTIIWMRT